MRLEFSHEDHALSVLHYIFAGRVPCCYNGLPTSRLRNTGQIKLIYAICCFFSAAEETLGPTDLRLLKVSLVYAATS